MSKAKPTARIHLILARKAPVIAVFRRGPSKQVALLEWNTETDKVTLGQWLKGRIYARRADLSPDGRHLIYFAANHRASNPFGGSWTAVSRMPYLTALHVYGWGHCWNGGGMFLNNTHYWLNGGRPGNPDASVKCDLKRVATSPEGVHPHMGEDTVTYFPVLLRDRWTEEGHMAVKGEQVFLFRKPVGKGWFLEKAFHAGTGAGRWNECYSETHRLIGPDSHETDMPDCESADSRGNDVFFTEYGLLMRMTVNSEGPGEKRVVADLNDMTFTEIRADYGARIGHRKSWHPLDGDNA